MCKQCAPGASPFFTRAGDEASQTVALFTCLARRGGEWATLSPPLQAGPGNEASQMVGRVMFIGGSPRVGLTQARLNYTCIPKC